VARYDVSEHGLLSDDAQALSEPELAAQNELAEVVLGLHEGDTYTGVKETTATLAVALQVNFQVEAGVEAYVLTASSRGARSKSYRDLVRVHPIAAALMGGLTSGDWNVLTSVRGPST
jgi:hypothetical protein